MTPSTPEPLTDDDLERVRDLADDDIATVRDIRLILAELERLHSWDGLMSLLDEHWPEGIFRSDAPPTESEHDPGPRIASLLRWVDRLRAHKARLETAHATAVALARENFEVGGQYAAERDALAAKLDANTSGVLAEIAAERARQDAKWGEQNHPDGTGIHFSEIVDADVARMACQDAADGGYLDWLHILREEVAEAFAESDPLALRAELIQVAAVAVAWVEAIDRRTPDTTAAAGGTDA